MTGASAFVHEPDPDNPGWHSWDLVDQTRFSPQVMGRMLIRREGEAGARLRMQPQLRHSNLHDRVHGGVILSLIDIAMFAVVHVVMEEANAAGALTLEVSNQFIGAASIDQPLDAVAEVLRETGRLVFVRGLIEQNDQLVASYAGTIRKPSRQ